MKRGSYEFRPLCVLSIIQGDGIVYQLLPGALVAYLPRANRKETKTSDLTHITVYAQLLANGLYKLVLLPDAPSQVPNFGVGRAVVAGMTKAVAVGTHLFIQARELRLEGKAWAWVILAVLVLFVSYDVFVELPRHFH